MHSQLPVVVFLYFPVCPLSDTHMFFVNWIIWEHCVHTDLDELPVTTLKLIAIDGFVQTVLFISSSLVRACVFTDSSFMLHGSMEKTDLDSYLYHIMHLRKLYCVICSSFLWLSSWIICIRQPISNVSTARTLLYDLWVTQEFHYSSWRNWQDLNMFIYMYQCP